MSRHSSQTRGLKVDCRNGRASWSSALSPAPLAMAVVPLMGPAIALIAWSMFMLFWMLLLRVKAIKSARMKLDPNAPRGEQMAQLPASIRWKGDNYNHLMEQPTLFYAIVVALTLMGEHTRTNVVLAWAYVVLRVAHSLVQSLVNVVEIRFTVFMISSFALCGLIFNAGVAAFF